ncbi:hypothetical protein [Radiobacillus sp. PE A8.2]
MKLDFVNYLLEVEMTISYKEQTKTIDKHSNEFFNDIGFFY